MTSTPHSRARQERRTRHARQGLVAAGTVGALATALVLGVTTSASGEATDTDTDTDTTSTDTSTDTGSDLGSGSTSSDDSGLVSPGSGGTSQGMTGGS